MRLGPLDVQILQLLRQDARLSFRELAERLGSTTPTVSARVKALEDIGILRGYRAQLDHAVLGGTSYVVTLAVHPQQAAQAQTLVATLPGAHQSFLLIGGRIVCHVHLRPPGFGLAQLHERLAAIPGLQTYDASEVIHSHEHAELAELPENVEVPCHQCKGPIHADPVKGKLGERTHVFCCRQCLADFRARYDALEAAKTGRPPAAARAARPSRGHHTH